MRTAIRWLLYTLGALASMALAAALFVYVASERVLDRRYAAPAGAFAVPTDPRSVREGARLARLYTCTQGCHGRDGEGAVMFDDRLIGRVVAPNLHEVAHRSDAELVAAIRHGIGPDGRSLVVMPSEAFALLTDEDLGRIIAYLRSLPVVPGPAAAVDIGPLGRIGLVAGKFKVTAQRMADSPPPPVPADFGAARGRYLAVTACGHCHGPALHGSSNPDFTAPDLAVVRGYPETDFRELLRTGTALGGREVGLMSAVARASLFQLTDDEIADLYGYLRHHLPEASGSR